MVLLLPVNFKAILSLFKNVLPHGFLIFLHIADNNKEYRYFTDFAKYYRKSAKQYIIIKHIFFYWKGN